MNRPSYKELWLYERKDRDEQLQWIRDAVDGNAKFRNSEPPYSEEEELARKIMQMHARIAELEKVKDEFRQLIHDWIIILTPDDGYVPDSECNDVATPIDVALRKRIAKMEGLVDELIEAGESMSLAVECENQIEANAYYSWKELVKDWKEREE